MSVVPRYGFLVAFGVGLLGGCSAAEVGTDDLVAVVEQDAITFSIDAIPQEILDRLASNRVILVGETHWIYEHRQLMAEFVRELHGRGFRQLILEFPQAAEWILEDYANGGSLSPGWVPPMGLSGDLITAVRDFNLTLSEGERVAVKGIDVMLDDYGGAADFKSIMGAISRHIGSPVPLRGFMSRDYATPDEQAENLSKLKADLEAGRVEFEYYWGKYWYDCLVEMVSIEEVAVMIRSSRDSNYDGSVKLRENMMKMLVDARLKDYPHRTIINVGGNHAQKSHLKGTDQEWLGDYLVHESSAIGGPIIVLNVVPTRITSDDSSIPDWDITDVSPPNEIWRLMSEVRPNELVFLPLDDPIFKEDGVLMNYEDTIYKGAPKLYYDVLISLPIAHRIPIDAASSG